MLPRYLRQRPALRSFLVVCLGAIVAPLDAMVNAAFPAITAGFAIEVAAIQWVVIAYLVAYGSLALVSGRFGDLYGHRRVFRAGLLVAALGFAGCAAAPAYGWLLAARVVQGVGIALVLGAAPPLALAAYPERERTATLSRYAAVLAVGLALGPFVGGALVEAFGWRAVYAVRVPLVLAALALLAQVPEPAQRPAARSFDGRGAALLMLWMSALVLALALPAAAAWPLALVAVAGLAEFVRHEARTASPIVRPALFRDLRFAVFNLTSFAVNFAGFAVFLLGPYFFVRVAGLSTTTAGLLLSCGPAGAVLGSVLAARLVRRHGTGPVAFGAAALAVVGVAAAATWGAGTGVAAMALVMFVQGAGIGLYQVAYTDFVLAALPVEDRGVAASLANLTRTLGVIGSATLLSALFRVVEAGALAGGADALAAFLAGYRFAFACAALSLGGFLIATLARPRIWRQAAAK